MIRYINKKFAFENRNRKMMMMTKTKHKSKEKSRDRNRERERERENASNREKRQSERKREREFRVHLTTCFLRMKLTILTFDRAHLSKIYLKNIQFIYLFMKKKREKVFFFLRMKKHFRKLYGLQRATNVNKPTTTNNN